MRGKREDVPELQLEMNEIFEPLFDDSLDAPRYYQVYGGRGSGKSFAASIAVVELSYSQYKHKILYLRQTMTSSEDSTIADVRTAIEYMKAEDDFYESKGVIYNKISGASITFKGIRAAGSQTAKLKSLSGITVLVIEEAEEVESFEEFSKIDESIRIKGKPLKVILLYNPTSALSSWIHKEWFIDGKPNPKRLDDTVYLHSTYLDNLDNLNESTIKRYERLAVENPIYYRNTIMAEWTLEAEGRLYDGWKMWPTLQEKGDTWYGLDFGYGGNDKTSLIKVTWIEGTYFVEEMFSEAKLRIHSLIRLMHKAGVPSYARIYADSAMPLLITEVREAGFTNIRKAKKGNVEAGIKKIQDKEIILIGDETSNIYFSYMTWRRDKKTGKLTHEPDELAAMRYAINSRKPSKTMQRPTKRRARRINGYL